MTLAIIMEERMKWLVNCKGLLAKDNSWAMKREAPLQSTKQAKPSKTRISGSLSPLLLQFLLNNSNQ